MCMGLEVRGETIRALRRGRSARKLAERVYGLLKHGHEYVRQGEEAYQKAYQQKLTKSLKKKAASLGCKLVPETMDATPAT